MKDLAFRLAPSVAVLPAASPALAGTVVRLSGDNRPYWCDGSGWFDLAIPAGADSRISTAHVTSDVASVSTALSNVTGLSVLLAANTTYAIDTQVMFQSAAATAGIRLTQAIPTGAVVVAQWNTPTSLTARALSNQRAADSGASSNSVDAANANVLATGSLLVITGANPGAVQIRFASEISGTSVLVKAGSNLVATQVS